MAKTGMQQNKKAHMGYMEQKALVNAMASAMWSADLPWVGRTGQMTNNIQDAWNRYVEFAYRRTYEDR